MEEYFTTLMHFHCVNERFKNNKCYAKLNILYVPFYWFSWIMSVWIMKMWECMFKKYKHWQYKHYIQNQNTCLSLDGGILTEPFWAWMVSVQK